MTYQPWY